MQFAKLLKWIRRRSKNEGLKNTSKKAKTVEKCAKINDLFSRCNQNSTKASSTKLSINSLLDRTEEVSVISSAAQGEIQIQVKSNISTSGPSTSQSCNKRQNFC